MRRWPLVWLALAGCYAPTAPANVPCDPGAPRCPTGQHCIAAGANAFVCSAADAGITTGDDAANRDAAIDAAPAIQRTYTATVAECISPLTPDPQRCRERNGNNQLVIDLRDSTTNEPWEAFVRFDLDDALAGRTVTRVRLRLVVTNASNAPGSDSGTVYAVDPFTLASLSTTAPKKIGAALAPSEGAVAIGDVVTFVLANPSAIANDDDGVNYYNLDGAPPPRLIVEAE